MIGVAIQLTEILSSPGMSLEDLLMEMDVSISCLCKHDTNSHTYWSNVPPHVYEISASGVTLSNEDMVNTVSEMKNSYSRLVAGVSESQSRESLSPGHLLFLAFDSLFNNYEHSVRELKAAVTGLSRQSGILKCCLAVSLSRQSGILQLCLAVGFNKQFGGSVAGPWGSVVNNQS